ncbi:MAG: hydrogenase formation protein HypD [Candidatus Altiarchaeota archaeon]
MDDQELINSHIKKINEISVELDGQKTFMEICGGHTNIILKYGIKESLPENIRLISGPGCPVCVSAQYDIDCIIELASKGIPVATYGDMMRVPGSHSSLSDIKAKGGKVFEVYSATELTEIEKKNPGLVFFGLGFETTAPMSAYLLQNGITVYSVHKLVPPAITSLLEGGVQIDGFLNPGHVSTIIGTKAYKHINFPQVISGFTPERILRALSILVELVSNNNTIVVNGYPEAVSEDGNLNAQKILADFFQIEDSLWRGLGKLPKSGLEVRDDELNAKKRYEDILSKVPTPEKTACRCGEILKGSIEPTDCPLYKKSCTPENPQGACMVSAEGSCAIAFQFGLCYEQPKTRAFNPRMKTVAHSAVRHKNLGR